MFVTTVLIVLCVMLIALLPIWPYSKSWGGHVAAGVGIVLAVLIILVTAGVVR